MLKWLSTLILFLTMLPAGAAEPAHRVFIASDSTASAYGPERAPRTGWGQALPSFLDSSWEVRNHAQSGRGSRSFIEQGRLDGIARDLRKGDVLLVQFGHNDEKIEDPKRYTEPLHVADALCRAGARTRRHPDPGHAGGAARIRPCAVAGHARPVCAGGARPGRA